MGIFKAQGLGAGKTLQHVLAFCPSNFGRLPVGGKYRFIFGSSPAVTGRDWQEGNNVRLSGNIGKGGGYGQYRVVAVTGPNQV